MLPKSFMNRKEQQWSFSSTKTAHCRPEEKYEDIITVGNYSVESQDVTLFYIQEPSGVLCSTVLYKMYDFYLYRAIAEYQRSNIGHFGKTNTALTLSFPESIGLIRDDTSSNVLFSLHCSLDIYSLSWLKDLGASFIVGLDWEVGHNVFLETLGTNEFVSRHDTKTIVFLIQH